ncbi:hypothetical protein AKJ09_06777 [Labilithrix luteola]|uniref:Uncharacterized protein n=1 Tax=Labilithrix luteola TaxID=1391654 RepID=A0A0K1Q2W7_9BACT|nr:hypothetical protein AKJ09_06777 [Labilithrix luteola]
MNSVRHLPKRDEAPTVKHRLDARYPFVRASGSSRSAT